MSLDLRQLQALRAVMAEGSVTAAARRLHRTQSVVSRLVQQLESRLRFELFRRERQRLVPTEAGLAFWREAERAFAALDEIDEAARALSEGRTLPLRLLAPSHIAHGLLPQALAAFERRRPGLRFVLEIRQREYVSHWVRNRQFDLGIAPLAEPMPGLDSQHLVRAPLAVALPPGHRWARRRWLRLAEVAGEPLVAVRTGTPMRQRWDEAFAAIGLRPRPRGEAGSALCAGQLAAHGLGLALVDPFVGRLLRQAHGALTVPLRPALTVDYHVLWPAGEPAGTRHADWLACLRETAQAIVDEQRA